MHQWFHQIHLIRWKSIHFEKKTVEMIYHCYVLISGVRYLCLLELLEEKQQQIDADKHEQLILESLF